jgi:ribosome-associated toxin RatA of RatAB toxin-antitoxin module
MKSFRHDQPDKEFIMSTTKTARTFLGLNTGFSILCSLTLLLLPDFFSELMFHAPASWVPLGLQFLAGGLLLFALSLIFLAANPYVTRGEVMLIVAMDVVWIAASAALVVFGYDWLTMSGIAIIEFVAVFVGIFALGQFLGARKIQPPLSRAMITSQEGIFKASVRRAVAAPPATVWQVMTDHPGYADVAENLSKVEVLSGQGKGMLRSCYGVKGENWTETCDTFEDGKSYGFKVHTDAPDYPYPFENLQGHWSVAPLECGAEFAINITAKPKGNFLTRTLFMTIARLRSKAVLIDLADAWSDRMERETKT